MNRNKKTIVSIVLLTIAVVICFFGYNFYQKKQEEVVSAEKLTAIHEVIKKFNNRNDRNERLNLLKDTPTEQVSPVFSYTSFWIKCATKVAEVIPLLLLVTSK